MPTLLNAAMLHHVKVELNLISSILSYTILSYELGLETFSRHWHCLVLETPVSLSAIAHNFFLKTCGTFESFLSIFHH